MTKRYWTLMLVGAMAMSCSPSHEELVVAGANDSPSSATSCTYAPVTTGLLSAGFMPIVWQEAASSGSGQELHYLIALTMINTLGGGGQGLQSATGQQLDTLHQYDVQITTADITFTTVGQGAPSSIPEVTVAATGYVPENGQGVAIFDLMSEASSKALANAHADFTLIANVTLSGLTGGSSPQSSNPFQFPIQIYTGPVPTCPDPGTVIAFTGGPCGEIQDGVTATCVDAGL